MFVSGQKEVNNHLLTYVDDEEFEEGKVSAITSYSDGVRFLSDDIDYDVVKRIERSRYGEEIPSEVDTYPLEQHRMEEVAEGIEEGRLPLTAEQVKRKLGERTDTEKAQLKLDFFY